MEEWLDLRASALARWELQGSAHASYLARFYLDWGRSTLQSFSERYGRDLVGALRSLCNGLAEPLSGAATHAYLPNLSQPGAIHTQIHLGMLTTAQRLGRMPDGLWLPACGYRPTILPALRSSEIRYLIADPSSVGELIPTQRPRWAVPGRLQVLLRDPNAAELIWSHELGYPGDPAYRAPHRDPRSGIELWRNGLDPDSTELYDPYDAYRRAEEHAEHFLNSIGKQLARFSSSYDRPGVAIVPIDLELLGRHWFEGPIWLRAVLMRTMRGEGPTLAAPIEYLRAYRARQTVVLEDGSWGASGDHWMWNTPAAHPLQQQMHQAELRMRQLVARFPKSEAEQERALNQALRELLIAQSSDWTFLIGQGQAEQALARVIRHLERFEQLAGMIETDSISHNEAIDLLTKLEELDNPFPHLNYRMYAEGDGLD
jgi:1,4-alpha-glucan branching enzyme